jgi:hypothetical protein
MTTTNGAELQLGAPVSTAGRIGQGTAIEQSRAVAEVQAAVYLARQFPRDEAEATRSMENSCRQLFVAERAFFRLPRAGEVVTGPTIHLARELARCWGHIHYGPAEMRRDDEHGQSEMMAYAWDVQSGTRSFATFIVPHKRDKKDWNTKKTVPVELSTTQEIYENNANNAARRLREQIFAVLPSWFTERAKQLCHETLETGNGKPIEERRAACIATFAGLGITEKQLEKKLELQSLRWSGHEVAQLAVIFGALQRGEIAKDVEFPPDATAITTADIAGAEPKPAPAAAPEQPGAGAQGGEDIASGKRRDGGEPGNAGPEPSAGTATPANTPAPAPEPSATPAESTSQGGYEITEQTGVTAEELPGSGAATESAPQDGGEQLPSSDGPKARRVQLAALATLLKDSGAESHTDQLAVLSLMLDQPIPALNVLSADEATYVYSQVEKKAKAGEFVGTLERARKIAAGG